MQQLLKAAGWNKAAAGKGLAKLSRVPVLSGEIMFAACHAEGRFEEHDLHIADRRCRPPDTQLLVANVAFDHQEHWVCKRAAASADPAAQVATAASRSASGRSQQICCRVCTQAPAHEPSFRPDVCRRVDPQPCRCLTGACCHSNASNASK